MNARLIAVVTGLAFGVGVLLYSVLVWRTTVEVHDPSGLPVAGAQVFQDGVLSGTTDTAGQLALTLAQGDELIARLPVDEHASYRPDHGGWTTRTYLTSRKVENDGSVTDFRVGSRWGVQILKVERDQTLIGWHLVVSLSWDASEGELEALKLRFNDASQYLYNLTDGQFFLEQVEIADDGQLWGSAEILFDPDNTRRPQTSGIGGFLSPPSERITMFPLERGQYASNNPATIIHELGHLSFGLADEYTGILPQRHYCTEAMQSSTNPQFLAGGARAACAMFQQWVAAKLCSRHSENTHRFGSFQPSPCWDTINAAYEDHAPLAARRWLITTPDERNAVVGTLPPLVEGWKPRISTNLNRVVGNLCAPFTFNDPAGTAGANGDVWVMPVSGGQYTLGDLKSDGTILAVGVHLGDRIKTTASQVVVDTILCTVTQ